MEQSTGILEETPTAVDKIVNVSSSYLCNLCGRSYATTFSLYRHQRRIHNVKPKCRYGGGSLLASSSVKKSRDGWKTSYLRCHRSGSFRSKSLGKRKPKAQGSCKMNRCCPAAMKVEDQLTRVVVHYYKTHCGHGSNLGDITHLRLTESEKALIAGKLSQGISFKHLLDDLRMNSQGKFDRLHLLTKRDLYNIQANFKLQIGASTNSEPDTWENWIEKAYAMGEDCPVLYYKDQGVAGEGDLDEQDFLLVLCDPIQRQMLDRYGHNTVCVDCTDVGPSADFVLLSVVVLDEYETPFPAAFCLSNRGDFCAYSRFFRVLQEHIGKVSPSVFVSDDRSEVYATWSRCMGEEYETRYLCPWWTEQAWRNIIDRIPPGRKAKRAAVRRRLQTLLVETDVERFHQEMNTFLEEMQEGKDTRNFASHFQDQFALRPEMWAHSFLGPDWSKTMHSLEMMHRALKCAFVKGKVFGHLARCVYVLDKLVQDRNNDRLAKTDVCGGEHEQCVSDVLVEVIEEDRLWKVKIGLEGDNHRVRWISDLCFVGDCTGSPCIHCYSCSCQEHSGHANSCVHVQAVVQLQMPTRGATTTLPVADKTLTKCVEEKMQTMLGFLKKRKFDESLMKEMQQQMDVWIDKMKRPHLLAQQPPKITNVTTVQPQLSTGTCNNVLLLIYPPPTPVTTCSTVSAKVPISRYTSPVCVNRSNTIAPVNVHSGANRNNIPVIVPVPVNVHSGFDHVY